MASPNKNIYLSKTFEPSEATFILLSHFIALYIHNSQTALNVPVKMGLHSP